MLRVQARFLVGIALTLALVPAVQAQNVDATSRQNVVDAMAAEFARRDRFMLTIAPEGTRSHTDHLKSGFYQIAVAASVGTEGWHTAMTCVSGPSAWM